VTLGNHFLFLRPVKFRAGRLDKKIVFRLELADNAVQLGHFGFVVDLFFLPLAKKVWSIFQQGLLPVADLARMNFVFTGQFCQCPGA